MVRVAGGQFTSVARGAPVSIESLCVDVTEVTRGAYHTCPRTVCRRADTGEHCTENRGDPSLPLNCVPHAQAEAFCAFRNARLPTAEEWEWLARGGSAGREYPWGDRAPDCRSSAGRACSTAPRCAPSGAFPRARRPTASSIWSATSRSGRRRARTTLSEKKNFVFVGGSWRSTAPESPLRFLRGSEGGAWWGTPGTLAVYSSPDVGFRCVDPW